MSQHGADAGEETVEVTSGGDDGRVTIRVKEVDCWYYLKLSMRQAGKWRYSST
jgi:hypothetical protein